MGKDFKEKSLISFVNNILNGATAMKDKFFLMFFCNSSCYSFSYHTKNCARDTGVDNFDFAVLLKEFFLPTPDAS